jgi:hypothetical protein
MGLKSDIKEVFLNNMTSGPTGRLKINPHQEKKVEELATGISDAIVKFMLSQEFRIIQLESDVDIESISTTAPLDATVKTETVMGQYAPILKAVKLVPGVGSQIASLIESNPIVKEVGKDGVSLPSLNLNKNYGQGGSLIVKGTSNINERKTNQAIGKSAKTKVVLLKGEVRNA